MHTYTQHHIDPVVVRARDTRVPYLDGRQDRIIAAAGDPDAQLDALMALIGHCYPESTHRN